MSFAIEMKDYDEKMTGKKVPLPEITSYDQLPLVLTVQDVARVLKLGVGMVYELLRSGELPSRRIGARGQFRVTRSDLIRYIEGESFAG
ncbi:hypothetical protein B5F15_15060 [Butyricicoccus pullicaecorum]|uniref:Helix-turn-helix domain-containing protein n=1 Tax=Butyricicoccus pullicaecorum TaxID=501571 RepID=A0A1Y4LEX1_9FIRM|nr:hypothetical protein B5F15_15060 [Butyricicoccus pullicaecorum]